MSDKTIETTEAKRRVFLRWQEQCEDARRQEHRNLYKRMRRAVKEGEEKWLDGVMKGLEDDKLCNDTGTEASTRS